MVIRKDIWFKSKFLLYFILFYFFSVSLYMLRVLRVLCWCMCVYCTWEEGAKEGSRWWYGLGGWLWLSHWWSSVHRLCAHRLHARWLGYGPSPVVRYTWICFRVPILERFWKLKNLEFFWFNTSNFEICMQYGCVYKWRAHVLVDVRVWNCFERRKYRVTCPRLSPF